VTLGVARSRRHCGTPLVLYLIRDTRGGYATQKTCAAVRVARSLAALPAAVRTGLREREGGIVGRIVSSERAIAVRRCSHDVETLRKRSVGTGAEQRRDDYVLRVRKRADLHETIVSRFAHNSRRRRARNDRTRAPLGHE